MHNSQSEEPGGHVIQHNPSPLRNRFQLSHRRWLQDIEDTKKYKARKKRFPRQRHGNQSYQLPRNLVDHHKLRIFSPGAARDQRSGGNADQRNQCR